MRPLENKCRLQGLSLWLCQCLLHSDGIEETVKQTDSLASDWPVNILWKCLREKCFMYYSQWSGLRTGYGMV